MGQQRPSADAPLASHGGQARVRRPTLRPRGRADRIRPRDVERLCGVLAKRSVRSGPVETHLLSSIGRCGLCGRTLAYHTAGRKSSPAYVCRPRFEGDAACRKISVSAPHAEQRVSKLVVDFLADKERVNRLLLRQAPPELVAKIQARETELIESRHALGQALNPPPGKPRMPLATYYEQAAAIEAELQELHKRMAVTREAALLAEVLGFGDAANGVPAGQLGQVEYL